MIVPPDPANEYGINIRINMGAYGGTVEASMPPHGWALLADLTNDGKCGPADLSWFTQFWLQTAQCLPADLDRNGSVSLTDFGLFSKEWQDVALQRVAPEITYQVSDCSFQPEQMQGMDDLRFSVTVQGNYIYFEDMMVANCCPDELSLEMIVQGNLITIYETEYTPEGCYCICDYPVTATLGPFAPGSYTLEVYEDSGGFIGDVVVTIE